MDNVNKMVELRNQARVLKEDAEFKRWVFAHSRDEMEYSHVMHSLATIAQFKPVEWQGKTGERQAAEMML